MGGVVAELSSAPLAALGGASSFFAFLFMMFGHIRLRRSDRNPEKIHAQSLRLSIYSHCVLWPGSAICIAYIGSKISPVLGLFLSFAAFGITVHVLDVQSKNFSGGERESGGIAVASIAVALVFGVFWQGLVEFLIPLFADHTGFVTFGVLLIVGSIFLTFIGAAACFFIASPDFSRRHLGDN
ncbi:MAG TPA: hypothetical protein PKE16_19510 [Hyphomicrobium sp.]|nr:hypothetical protein [Hyphomicrobium sp.]